MLIRSPTCAEYSTGDEVELERQALHVVRAPAPVTRSHVQRDEDTTPRERRMLHPELRDDGKGLDERGGAGEEKRKILDKAEVSVQQQVDQDCEQDPHPTLARARRLPDPITQGTSTRIQCMVSLLSLRGLREEGGQAARPVDWREVASQDSTSRREKRKRLEQEHIHPVELPAQLERGG
eukprot:766238-Hanusia_phi.AAC.4